ncbi:MAG: anthrone oxygenase family protein [Pseudomonadota bacterium]
MSVATLLTCLLFACIGLMGGFFFAWTNPAMMGFARTSPATYVAAMQSINAAVQNPVFFVLFFGTVPLGLLVAAASGFAPAVVFAALCYGFAVAITIFGNVPMNSEMAEWTLDALPPAREIEAFRLRWMHLNTARCVACCAGLMALSLHLSRG